jgi:hypothetical protein
MTEKPHVCDTGPAETNPTSLRLFTDSAYEAPTPNDLRALMRRIILTGSRVGDLVGAGSRTVRTCTGGERSIPYSAWQLLILEAAGIAADASCEFLATTRRVGGVFT